MRILILFLTVGMFCHAMAEEIEAHRFDINGTYQTAGLPDLPTKIIVLAEKSLRLDFPGLAADWKPMVQIYRVTSARKVALTAPTAEVIAGTWQWTWTPPKTSGLAQYEIQFNGEPKRVVLIEARDPAWMTSTLKMLSNQADWDAQGLSADERAAITKHGIQLGKESNKKDEMASLQMIPHQGNASRRRVLWDAQATNLVVWRPGPATGDLEVRAPRWWISPAALATDQGLIRFLDLFSEPALNP